ncbi:MAG TPA: hypothetical protein PLI99_01145 [archaeon]|nr:hypothetical protein [archaeon]
MVNMTLAIPEELKKEMDEVKFVNWSEVARAAFKEKLIQFQLFQKIASKSKLTQKDANELSKKINRAASERFMKEVMALRK